MKLNSLFTLAIAALLFAASCDEAESNDAMAKIKADASLSSLAAAIETAGLASSISSATNITIFAPNNTAIGTNLNGVTGDRLSNLLKYHVANGRILASTLTGAANDSTQHTTLLAGNNIFIVNATNVLTINGNRTITGAIRNTPTTGIPGFKGDARIVSTIEADNGVIHIVDGILWPDAELNVLEAAAKRYTVGRATGAVVLAGLATNTSALVGAGPVTLFAPINPPNTYTPGNAFALVDGAGINLAADPAVLVATLNTHVLADDVTAAELRAGTSFTSASGVPLLVKATSPLIVLRSALMPDAAGTVYNVPVVAEDIVCKNGRMHMIGNLIIPQPPAAAKLMN